MSSRRKVLFSFLAIFLFFVILEATLHLVDAVRGGPPDPWQAFANSKNTPWIADLLKDFAAARRTNANAYRPFLEWERRPYRSTYLNVEFGGLRKTWNPPVFVDEPLQPGSVQAHEVLFAFGGSTMFGQVARDDYTIPSQISRHLNGDQSRVKVLNYAQTGYTFTQCVVKLALLLQEGKRPDEVIFYGGGVDVVAAYDKGAPNALFSEDLLRRRLESRTMGLIRIAAELFIKDSCKTCRLLIDAGRAVSPGAFQGVPRRGLGYNDAQLRTLATGIAENFGNSLSLVDGLSQAFGFRYAVFWEPALYVDKPVGDETKLFDMDSRLRDEKFLTLYAHVNNIIKQTRWANFYDISDVLTGRAAQFYLDGTHVSEDGNAVIAKKIADVLRGERAPPKKIAK